MKQERRKQQQTVQHMPPPLSSSGILSSADPMMASFVSSGSAPRSSYYPYTSSAKNRAQYRPNAKRFANADMSPSLSMSQLECDCDMNQIRPVPMRIVSRPKLHGYSDADIRLFWLKGFQSVTFDAEIRKLPTFELQDLFIVERKITLSTGDYSRLTCHLTFSRNLSFYWVQIYQPALMVVMISWVSFWISRESAPARVTLGIMTVLTMTTLMTTTNGQLPKTKERNRKKLKTLLQKSHKKTLKCSTSCQLNTTEELPCECDKLTSTTSLNASTWMHPVDPFAIPQSTTTIPKYPRFQRHSLNSFKKLSTKKFRNHHCCSSSDIDKYHSGRL
ncbi:Gamma-aminobutyric acid receptor [Trichinella spiralis]|uniref:Gamma-aminobutyric acid receptor n=1 Tax=Trichinella spiralis TaxID=6334 RepID=A0ABR3KCG8_TRISP